jgi:hypothetical protein
MPAPFAADEPFAQQIADTDRCFDRIDRLLFQIRYVQRLASRLGKRYQHAHEIVLGDIAIVSDAYRSGQVSEEEWDELMLVEVAARAVRRAAPDSPEVLVVLELSKKVDMGDVSRVHNRAQILRRLGLEVEACVDGDFILPDARSLAEQLGVVALVRRVAAA